MYADGCPPVLGDRGSDLPLLAGGVPKPPVLSRATQRTLCLLCLAAVVYGTLGPITHASGPWLNRPKAWEWVLHARATDGNDLLTNFAVYVPVGIAFRLVLRRRGRAGWPDLGLGLLLSIGLSYLTELCQQWMPGRSASLTDVLLNSLGALAGCLGAPAAQQALRQAHGWLFFQSRNRQPGWGSAAGVAALMLAGALLYRMNALLPAGSGRVAIRAEPRFDWVPFRAQFAVCFAPAAAEVLEQAALYTFVALLWLFLTQGRGRAATLLLLLGLAGLVELGRAFLAPGGGDATALVLAGLAWVAATRLWSALYPTTAPRTHPGRF